MKKQDLFKFSLTAMCVAVLSACGSSGGGSLAVDNANTTPSANANANTGAANSAELAAAQKAAQEAAAQKAAAEKAAAEAAAKQAEAEKAAAAAKTAAEKAAAEKAAAEAKAAAEKAAAEKAAKEAAAKAAADQAAAVKKAAEEAAKKALAEKDAADKKAAADKAAADKAAADKAAAEKAALAEALKAQPFGNKDMLQNTPVKEGNSFVGFKHVVKNKSNLATNSSVAKDSTSDIPTMMGIQNPQRSLDNIVVAEPLQKEAGAPRTYLEDLDTRTLHTGTWQALNNNGSQAGVTAHAEKAAGKSMANKSIGNTALQNIYINSITLKDGKTGEGYNPAIEVERNKLTDAHSKANSKLGDLNNAFQKASAAVTKFEDTLDGYVSQVGNPTAPAAPYATNGYITETARLRGIISSPTAEITTKELAQQELDVLLKKHNQLSEAKDKANAPIADQQVVVANALNALNTFNAANPAPNPTTLTDVSQVRATAGTTTTSGTTTGATGYTFGKIRNPNGNGEALYETKTDTMGKQVGAIWNFSAVDIQNRHQNFTEFNNKLESSNSPNVVKKGFLVHTTKDLNGNLRVNQYDITPVGNSGPTNALNLRTQDYSVAEIYGYRSKAAGSYDKPLDVSDNFVEPLDNKTPANNLPLVNDYKGARLQHVQYGRVTSALSDRTSTDDFYKTGVRMNDVTKTYVASFGEYGVDGTENHFFFRGIDNVGGVGGTTLAKLKEDTKNGVITYEGHAVTYGLNNNFMGNREIPTALGNGSGFVSGNHAKAAVNLATNAVTGSIFNKWYDPASPKALRDIDLVQFKGTIADNGNIAGDAVRVDNQTTGLFGAALYGAGAEMGGTVASHDKAAGKHWGGVFGAIRTGVQEAPKTSPQDSNGTDGGR